MDNLSETINFQKPDTKQINTAKIIKIEDISPNSGETPQKALIQSENSKKEFSVIIKAPQLIFRSKQEKSDNTPNSDLWINRWQYLRDAEIPTLDWVRKIDNQRIAMPDLTRDGSKVERVETFLTHNPEQNNYELKDQCQDIINKADKATLLLPGDDALAVISHPNKKPKLIVLDLGGTQKANDSEYHPDVIKNWNKNLINIFNRNPITK